MARHLSSEGDGGKARSGGGLECTKVQDMRSFNGPESCPFGTRRRNEADACKQMLDSALAGHWVGVVSLHQSRDETRQRNRDQKGLGSNPSFLAMPLAKLIEMMGTIIPSYGSVRQKSSTRGVLLRFLVHLPQFKPPLRGDCPLSLQLARSALMLPGPAAVELCLADHT